MSLFEEFWQHIGFVQRPKMPPMPKMPPLPPLPTLPDLPKVLGTLTEDATCLYGSDCMIVLRETKSELTIVVRRK